MVDAFDLEYLQALADVLAGRRLVDVAMGGQAVALAARCIVELAKLDWRMVEFIRIEAEAQIGRASCRERVCLAV